MNGSDLFARYAIVGGALLGVALLMVIWSPALKINPNAIVLPIAILITAAIGVFAFGAIHSMRRS